MTTTIAGRVVDESGNALVGVSVTGGGITALTDANGLFALRNAVVPQSRAVIIAKKTGYFNAARAAAPSSNGATYMQLAMAAHNVVGSLSSSGGTVTFGGGASIALPSSGVKTATGGSYSGMVSVHAKLLSTSDPMFSQLFQGDLMGQQTDSSQVALTSYGVILADLEGSNGEKLQPATTATISVPISASQLSSAPSTIPLWYFDEALGMWKEDGSATKQGSSYKGSVSHFSAWNCDWRGPWGTVHGRILCGGVPLSGIVVNLNTSGNEPVTDGAGEFTARVPAGTQNVQLQVIKKENKDLFYTNNPVVLQVIADQVNEAGDFELNSPCPSYVKGTIVGCDEKTLMPGMIVATWNGGMSYTNTQNGSFNLVAPAGTDIVLSATSSTGDLMQPRPFTTNAMGQITDIGQIVACNTSNDVIADIAATSTDTTDGRVLVFSPDGSLLAASKSNGDIALYDTKTWTQTSRVVGALGTFRYYYYQSYLRFSPDGSKMLIQDAYSQSIGEWSVQGAKLATISANSAAFAADGQSIIAANYQGAKQYDLQGNVLKTLSLSKYNIVAIGAASNGMMAFEDYDSKNTPQVELWDIANDKSTASYKIVSMADSMSNAGKFFSYDRTLLGFASYSGITIYNAVNGTVAGSLPTTYNNSYGIAPDNTSMIGQYRVGQNNTVALINIADGKQKHIFDPPTTGGFTNGVAISPDGKQAVAAYPGQLRVWKVQ